MLTLDVLAKASANLNCRDKSVKVLQYGARIILGYYSSILNNESLSSVQTILTTCTLGRRSFRLFRSINNIQLLIHKMDKLSNKNFFLSTQNRVYVVECIEAFEQLCWALFFLFDNIIFGIKMGVLDLKLQKYEGLFFPCWFAADASMFVKTAISLYGNMQSRRAIKRGLLEKEGLFSILDGGKGRYAFPGFSLGFGARKAKGENVGMKAVEDEGACGGVAECIDTVNISHNTTEGMESVGMNSNTADDEDITEEDFDQKSGEQSDNVRTTSLSDELLQIDQIMKNEKAVKVTDIPDTAATAADITQKQNLNISDFPNTSISEILSSNTNITKILSTSRNSEKEVKYGKNGARYDYLIAGAKGSAESTGDSGTGVDDVQDISPDSTNCTEEIPAIDNVEVSVPTDSSAVDKIRALDKQDRELYWKLVKSIVDMGVSGSFNRQLPVKKAIGEGGLGVLGVISASMAIYEEVTK